jgi:hypothetical protein
VIEPEISPPKSIATPYVRHMRGWSNSTFTPATPAMVAELHGLRPGPDGQVP